MILVVANYRTGSTTACQELAGRYSYSNVDEVFSFDREPGCKEEFKRLIINKKTDVVIKIMPNQITESEKVIPDFINKLINAAEEIYYTVRLDFEAQLRSWYVCYETQRWHNANESNKIMPTVDVNHFSRQAMWLMEQWNMIDQLYKQNPGERIILENRKPAGGNAPYTFNDQDINNTIWPAVNKQLLQQFNNLTIIKTETT